MQFLGQDQHVGMKAPPHDLVLENSILSMDKVPPVRVQVTSNSIIYITRYYIYIYCRLHLDQSQWTLF